MGGHVRHGHSISSEMDEIKPDDVTLKVEIVDTSALTT